MFERERLREEPNDAREKENTNKQTNLNNIGHHRRANQPKQRVQNFHHCSGLDDCDRFFNSVPHLSSRFVLDEVGSHKEKDISFFI